MSWISLNNICLICCIYIYIDIYTHVWSVSEILCVIRLQHQIKCPAKNTDMYWEGTSSTGSLLTVFWPSSILPLHLSGLLLGENILREVSHYCFSNERKGCREGKKRTSSTLWKSFQGCYPEISGEKYLKKERHASACEGVPNIYSMSYMKPDQTETKIKTWINATA